MSTEWQTLMEQYESELRRLQKRSRWPVQNTEQTSDSQEESYIAQQEITVEQAAEEVMEEISKETAEKTAEEASERFAEEIAEELLQPEPTFEVLDNGTSSATAVLRVQVLTKDDRIPVAEALVRVARLVAGEWELVAVRETDHDGRIPPLLLPDGTYEILTTAAGFQREEPVKVEADSGDETIVIELQLLSDEGLL